jgi:hypothetical protein
MKNIGVVVIVIVLAVIGFAIKYWFIWVPVALIAFAVWLFSKHQQEQATQKQVAEYRERESIRDELTRSFECNVAGVTFGSRQKKLRTIYDYYKSHDAWVEADLEREPGNKHDPNAIKVMASLGYEKETASGNCTEHKKNIGMIGYVPAETAKEIAPYLDSNHYFWAHMKEICEFYAEDKGDDIISITLEIKIMPTEEEVDTALTRP